MSSANISVDPLFSDGQEPRPGFVNVYVYGAVKYYYGYAWATRRAAIDAGDGDVAYRIHVRMKEAGR